MISNKNEVKNFEDSDITYFEENRRPHIRTPFNYIRKYRV